MSRSSLEEQSSQVQVLQSASAADGNGTAVATDGFEKQMVEIQKSGTGTCSIALQGSDDGSVWYAVGFQRVDAQASPARSTSAITVGAGTFQEVFQVLDPYPNLRAVQSSTAGTVSLTAKVYLLAV